MKGSKLILILSALSTSTLFPFTAATHGIDHHNLHRQIVRRQATEAPSQSASTSASQPTTSQDVQLMQTRRTDYIVKALGSPKDIPKWLGTLQPDGKWPDSEIDYTTGCEGRRASWPAQNHWLRILLMAGAWHGGLKDGEQYTNDVKLRDAISSAMDYWFGRDMSNVKCLDEGGTDACPCDNPDNTLWNTNWFSNVILIPRAVGQACLLLDDTLTNSQRDKCVDMTLRAFSVFYRQEAPGFLSGANIIDIAKIGIDVGLLTSNETLLQNAFEELHNEVTIHNEVKADGIRQDGSFAQHLGILYNGNYGKDYINSILDVELVAANTQYQAEPSSQKAMGILFDADRWMIVRNTLTGVLHWDFSVLDRFISFPVADNQATGSIKITLSKVRELGEKWSSEPLTAFATTLSQNSTSANAGDLNGNRMFFTNDYMVHRGQNYVSTLKMYSSRTLNSECVNSQNPLGFHLSDGALHTYVRGDEYEDIAAAWNWHMIPGTTVDYEVTPLSCDTITFTGVENFVGGVSDGDVGIAAMRYTNPSTKKLSWQKAWFFLDNDVQRVMVSKLSSQTNASVLSVLDQRRLSGKVIIDGTETQSPQDIKIRSTVWHGDIGYSFPKFAGAAAIKVEVDEKTGNWSTIGTSDEPPATVDLFTASIRHDDLSVPLSYTAFPGTTAETFAKKRTEVCLRTIKNDDKTSALFDNKHNTAYAIFWDSAGGSIKFTPSEKHAPITIQVNGNIALIYKPDTGKLTVADPSQLLKGVKVTITLGNGRKPNGWGEGRSKFVDFELPSGGIAGSSVTRSV